MIERFQKGDRVRWIVHQDEPELTGTVIDADHELDYYVISVDRKNAADRQMRSGMPGKNIIGAAADRQGNVISIATREVLA